MKGWIRMTKMPFDQENGLVYTERIMKANDHTGCFQSKRCVPLVKLPQHSQRGTRSLVDTAIITLFGNTDLLDASALQNLPQAVIEQLWKWANDCKAVSLHVWQVFARTNRMKVHDIKGRRIRCMRPACLAPVANDANMAWLVHLTIRDVAMDTDDAISIWQIPNLQAIYIQGSGTKQELVSDRILRAWASAATDSAAMSKLELMFIDGQREITPHCLQYLSQFPALQLFTVFRCGEDWEKAIRKGQSVAGWSLCDPNPVQQLIISKTHSGFDSGVVWADFVENYIANAKGVALSNKPVLELIGSDQARDRGMKAWHRGFNHTIFSFQRDTNAQAVAPEVIAQPVAKRRKLKNNVGAANYQLMTGNV
ncbi:hypothetical protein CBER1_03704 [Cercospora berteroae]|uniref:Uncharacterized protein n=1 Tax=Cercospora berteroae TaxID=357750 RepID=A0A2S6C789_9PEZI|nr:hypothetical protein CBER1_03704 [Cercospora berteroae]